jgi:hypothetical protein
LELRPYQTDIINQTINSDESTLIQVPTGGGMGDVVVYNEGELELNVSVDENATTEDFSVVRGSSPRRKQKSKTTDKTLEV